MSLNLFARKDLRAILAESEGEKGGLKRALGALNLVTLGIGAIIGTGIFVLTGTVAGTAAGPAIVICFIIAAAASAFAGLCYAEFASVIPIAGSAYSYSYTTLGEIVAWIIGWALILEYAVGAATVAVGWSGYINSFLNGLGIYLPARLNAAPGSDLAFYHGRWVPAGGLKLSLTPAAIAALPHQFTDFGHIFSFNMVAFIGIAIVTLVLVIGVQESANINSAIVVIKVSVLLIFIGIGGMFMSAHPSLTSANWHPFIPPNTTGHFGDFGWTGILRGAQIIFFAYIGFDAVSTAAQEARNPSRDMPIGILGSLVICTILYIVVGGILTALVPYKALAGVADPIAVGMEATGVGWGSMLVIIGAVCGLTSTMLVMLLGQSRIFYTMSQDGLLWGWASRVHPRFRTPYVSTILVGICVAVLASVVPLTILAQLTSIATLFAFTVVCAGVWVLRKREPDLPRPFKTPWVPFVPIMGMLIAFALMLSAGWFTWKYFLLWLATGLVVYFTFGRKNSHVQREAAAKAIASGR